MDILSIIKDIEEEGKSRRRTLTDAQRQSFKHFDINPFGLSTQSGRTNKRPVLNWRQPRQIVAQIYRIPVLGYFLNLLAYSIRLPTQIRKLQQEIHQLRCAVAVLESRLAGKNQNDEELDREINRYKVEINKLNFGKM
jgi:hypothetical protein